MQGTRSVIVNGMNVRLHESSKQGPLVVFVHGLISDHRTWRPQLDHLGGSYHCVAYDMRYHGLSAKPPSLQPYSLAQHASDLAELIHALGSGPVHVVAHGYGACVAIAAALENQSRVRSLTLVEPSLETMLYEAQDAPVRAAAEMQFEQIHAELKRRRPFAAMEAFAWWVDNGQMASWRAIPQEYQAMVVDNAHTIGLWAHAPETLKLGSAEIRALSMPVLVLNGQETQTYFARIGERLSGLAPAGKHLVVPATSHDLHNVRPEAFNALVRKFLDQAPALPRVALVPVGQGRP